MSDAPRRRARSSGAGIAHSARYDGPMHEARVTDELDEDLPPIEDDPELDGPDATGAGDPPGVDVGPPAPTESARVSGRAGAPIGDLAGGVVLVRRTAAGARIAVLESGGHVSLPKAEVGEGSSAETAALDAAHAFTGLDARLVESIGESEEDVDGAVVRTWFWLARPSRVLAGDAVGPTAPGFTLHWVDVEEALDALDSAGERAVVERVRRRPELRSGPRPLASPDTVAIVRELDAFRDESGAGALADLDALTRARIELERAEERLDRGDAAGARRARARAERATLATLDGRGRAIALQRALDRAPERLRATLAAATPGLGSGVDVPLDLLTTIHAAVDAALDEDDARAASRRAAQSRAAIALGATALGALVAAAAGLLGGGAPELASFTAALVFLASGALGGWTGETLQALRGPERGAHGTSGERRGIVLPMAAAAGGLTGLALGAFLTSGLQSEGAADAGFVLGATFAAGWLVRTLLPR